MMLSFFNEMSLKIFHPVDMPAVDYLTIILNDLCNMQHVEKTFEVFRVMIRAFSDSTPKAVKDNQEQKVNPECENEGF